MKTNAAFAIFALAGMCIAEESASALRSDQENMQLFMDWTTKQGKNYATRSEFNLRQGLWLQADDIIAASNKKHQESGSSDPLVLAHNMFSDMTKEEKKKLLGYKVPEDVRAETHRQNRHFPPKQGIAESHRGGRKLCIDDKIDWWEAKRISAVRDQGNCGSCYAFAALTVLESKIALTIGEEPVHLSEQQVVDCSHYNKTFKYSNYGCDGGFMVSTWEYGRDHGLMLDSDYPYRGVDQNCQFTEPYVRYNVKSMNWFNAQPESPEQIVDKLTNGPISVAIDADCDAFFYYSRGVMRSSDCKSEYVNHGVALIGYHPQTDEPYQYTYSTYGWIREETFSGEEPLWTIQNSWGEYWGYGGFVKIAIEDGHGFAFMNSYLENIEVENIQINN